jgi:hypothetical protein
MLKFHSTKLNMKRSYKPARQTLTLIAALTVMPFAGCSKDSDKGGGGGSNVPNTPAIKNSVAAGDLSASLDTQAEFATQFNTSLETVLGATQSTSTSLAENTAAPVTDTVSGSMTSSIDLSSGLKALVKNPTDSIGCANSLTLLRDSLPLTKALQRAKSSISKDAMLKNQKYLVVTENPLTDSQAVNLSFSLTPEFATKSASSLSGSYISGSDGNTYYNSGTSDFDVDFSKFFQAVISSATGSEATTNSDSGSSKIKGNSKGLFTVIKDSKILSYSEQGSASIKIAAGGKTADGSGAGSTSFELNGTTGTFKSQKEGSMTGSGKSASVKQTTEIKKVDDTTLTIAYSWTVTKDGATKSKDTTVTLKRNEDKSCTASFNPALDSAALEELDGSVSGAE